VNIIDILDEQVRQRPGVAAIIDGAASRVTTFAQLDDASRRLAALFRASGLKSGDRVLIFYPMSLELYATLLAAFRLGLVAMFLDPSAGRAHIERCCELGKPRGLIAGTKAHLLRLISPALRAIDHKFVIGAWVPGALSCASAGRMEPLAETCPATDDTPALLTFTSGGTGQPKAAMRSHGFLVAQHKVLSETLRLEPGSVDLATLPIFVLANLASGVTSLIPDADLRAPARINPAPVLRQIDRHRPSTTAASPAFLQRLAEYALASKRTIDGFSRMYSGGAPVFPRFLELLHEAAPGASIVAVFGSTEAEPIAEIEYERISPEDQLAMSGGKGLLTGVPVAAIDLRIIQNRWGTPLGPFTGVEFDALHLPAEEPGEIVVHGPHVLPGYLHGQGDEETKFRVDGEVWHRTGDMGYLDREGRLWLLGRCVAVLNDARGVLYPFAVECAAQQHAGVVRAALASVNGRRLLAVEPADKARPPDAGELAELLAWAGLDSVRTVDRIPVDARHNAKVDYPALRRLLGSE
jgi:acyl-CoA synthetase (AMP-forming)/AMP-acid ligase II